MVDRKVVPKTPISVAMKNLKHRKFEAFKKSSIAD
jgi:hypothetical protein